MTEIPKEALAKVARLMNAEMADMNSYDTASTAFARYIADVSEKAKAAARVLSDTDATYAETDSAIDVLNTIILPNPEADLLKEAREICARDAEAMEAPRQAQMWREGVYDDSSTMRCTLAALRKGRE